MNRLLTLDCEPIWFGPTCHCKAILRCSVGSPLFLSRQEGLNSDNKTPYRGHCVIKWLVSMEMMWIICYGFAVTRSQSSWTSMGDLDQTSSICPVEYRSQGTLKLFWWHNTLPRHWCCTLSTEMGISSKQTIVIITFFLSSFFFKSSPAPSSSSSTLCAVVRKEGEEEPNSF